jgi:hypothetical protein
MSVIDEKTIAGLLERIGVLKKELSNLESAILAIKLEPETVSPDSGSLRSAPYPGECSPEPDLTVSESPEAAPAESPEPVEQPVEEPETQLVEEPVEQPVILSEAKDLEATDLPADEDLPAGEPEEEPIDIAPVDDTPIDISISDIEDLPEELGNRGSAPLTNRGSTPLTNHGSAPVRSLSGAEGPAPTASTLGQIIEEPKKSILDTAKADTAVMDVMAEKQAWRTDRPGMPVKNIISAISLNDRVYLINTLFGEDPMLFQETIGKFNAMGSLSEALAFIAENHSDWDMSSEPVYRLMMAVRRKLA